MKIKAEPASHTHTSHRDLEAISALEKIFSKHKLVKPDLKRNDTWPNHDGYIEICVRKDGPPFGTVRSQVKSLSKKNLGNKITYSLDEKYLAYCKSNIDLPNVFIGVDKSRIKAYWMEITPGVVDKMKSKTIEIPRTNEISISKKDYYSAWHDICAKRNKLMERYYKREEEKAIAKHGKYPVISKGIKRIKPDFSEISTKFQQIFVSKHLKEKYYYGFLYLLEPFYQDDDLKRDELRELFQITKKEEKEFIKELRAEKLIDIIGNLIYIRDIPKAKKNLNNVLNLLPVKLDQVIKIFL